MKANYIYECSKLKPDAYPVCDWKNELEISTCPGNLVWNGCKSNCDYCDDSCESSGFTSGCFCPEGSEFIDGKCKKIQCETDNYCECPDGKEFFCSASEIISGACAENESCQMYEEDGEFLMGKCTPNRVLECKAWGDPHVVTFDGAQNDVYGVASYYYARLNSTTGSVLPNFTAIMETSPWNGVSVAHSMEIEFPVYSGR